MASKGNRGNSLLNSEISEQYVSENWVFDEWANFYGLNFNEHFGEERIKFMRENLEPSKGELYRLTYPTDKEIEDWVETKYSKLKVGDTVPLQNRNMTSFSYDKERFQNFVVEQWVGGSRRGYFHHFKTLDILVAPKGTGHFPLDGVPFVHQAETFVPSENWVVKKIETMPYYDFFPPSFNDRERNIRLMSEKTVRLLYIEQENQE